MRFGFVAFVVGSITTVLALLTASIVIGPLIFWLAWNVLDFAHAVGLPELGFWGILLATLFLALGWGGKMLVTAIVFIADPAWFHGAASVHWPAATFRNFVAIALIVLIATRPRASRKWERRRRHRTGWSGERGH